jgi:hypothetical protein
MKDMAENANNDSGILYVLTNPVMPGLVKIGLTTQTVEERIRELSSATGVPVRFECYFAAEVPSMAEKEHRLHQIFLEVRVNPNREFFRIDPERAVLAIKMGDWKEVTPGKLDVAPAEEKAFEKADEIESERLSRFSFDAVHIPVGATLQFTRDESLTATVEPHNKLKFEGQITSISDAAIKALKKKGKTYQTAQGPMYWLYNGKTLNEIRTEKGV